MHIQTARLHVDEKMQSSPPPRSHRRRSATTIPPSAFLCTAWFVVLYLSAAVLVVPVPVSARNHLYTDSFPTNDEYDFMILDSDSVYGSPYGGFSRSVHSRLAKVPLKLPNVDVELFLGGGQEEKESSGAGTGYLPDYTTIRDQQGRPFACRVYHEDELDPKSLNESMFNAPILKKQRQHFVDKKQQDPNGDAEGHDGEGEVMQQDATDGEAISTEPAVDDSEGTDGESQQQQHRQQQEYDEATAATGSKASSSPDQVALANELSSRLESFVGMCAQIHMGWWSYSWCHQADIKQFHVVISKKDGHVQNLEIEDITVLGKFSERRVKLPENDNVDFTEGETWGKPKYFGDRKPLGAIVETFVDGDVCPNTHQPRQTQVTIQCCSDAVIAKSKGGVLRDGVPIETDKVSLIEITESKNPPCVYRMNVCTQLLCASEDGSDDVIGGGKGGGEIPPSVGPLPDMKSLKRATDGRMDPSEVEKMSVVEVLHSLFGTKGKICILFGTGSWWVYEFCPGGTIRQFHEMTVIDRSTGSAKNIVETEHYLGRYHAPDHEKATKDDEWKNMVNVTVGFSGGSGGSSSSTSKSGLGLGGNGAYYFQEYTNGDACINEDVEDSAAYGTKRATTVRYYCGNSLQMTVKEDSTCHYVVDITVPALCGHPLFKAPISKRQVVKCLPLPLSYEEDF